MPCRGRRAAATQQRGASETRLVDAREELTQAEAAQRKSEAAAQDQEALLKKLQGQQFQVKTNDAYTALLHEMERAQAAISEAETHVLEAMEASSMARARQREIEVELRGAGRIWRPRSAPATSARRSCRSASRSCAASATRSAASSMRNAAPALREDRDAATPRRDDRRRADLSGLPGRHPASDRDRDPSAATSRSRAPTAHRILVLEEQLRG